MKLNRKLAMSNRKPVKADGTPNRMYPLLADNVVEHIKMVQNANRATDWHFRVGSKFFNALREHIRTAKDSTCVIDKEGRAVSCHRGTGYAVTLRNPCVHFAMPGEIEHMSFYLHVGYEATEDDAEYDSMHSRDVEREYRLYCPTDLELNFTQEKFKLWAQTMRKELDAERLKKERKDLDRLLKRHPTYATEKLLKTKPSA